MIQRLIGLLFALCVPLSLTFAQHDKETWSLSMDSITVRGHYYSSPLKEGKSGLVRWNLQSMSELPQILGNADPMHYAQLLPGVQTNNEFRSGIHIQGCENSHHFISVEGVPIYNVQHLLGFFSSFNAPHYSSMLLSKTPASAGAANRLGGELTMELPAEGADSLRGEVAVGAISSQGTLRLPLGRRTSLGVSLRVSYMNLLYSRWLEADGNQIRYSFYDANLTLHHVIDERNKLLFDYYGGRDGMSVLENRYFADMRDHWGNQVGGLHWWHDSGSLAAKTTMYVSSYHNRFDMSMQNMKFSLPSSITAWGLKSKLTWLRWEVGADVVWHHIHPQSLEAEGSFNRSDGSQPVAQSLEGSLFGQFTQPLPMSLSLSVGLRGSAYSLSDASFWAVDPSVALFYDDHETQFALCYAQKHQYLFQTGFSAMGLPSEFWLSCNKNHRPQYAHEFSVRFSTYLFHRQYRLSADAYYKQLYHQVEYMGSVLDYLNMRYDIERSLIDGKGSNYGFSFMLNKCSGKLTGWVSYAYSHARRQFAERSLEWSYPASHDRPHELNIVLAYSLKKHWSFGSTLVYASGTPFTAVSRLAFINGNLLLQYEDYHASRLKPYLRLNVSANYKWHTNFAREQGLNFTLYNVTAHSNELFYYVSVNDDGLFAYRPVRFLFKVLPSISYFCKF